MADNNEQDQARAAPRSTTSKAASLASSAAATAATDDSMRAHDGKAEKASSGPFKFGASAEKTTEENVSSFFQANAEQISANRLEEMMEDMGDVKLGTSQKKKFSNIASSGGRQDWLSSSPKGKAKQKEVMKKREKQAAIRKQKMEKEGPLVEEDEEDEEDEDAMEA